MSHEFSDAVHVTRNEAAMNGGLSRTSIGHNAIRRVAGLLLSVVLAATLGMPQAAHADPLNLDPAAGGEVALPWRTLGLTGDITLVGANTNQDFTVPVPSGFSIIRLRGLIHAPVDFAAGFVEIVDRRGALMATIDLPAVAPNQAVVPFDVDVAAAQADASGVGLSFTVREVPRPGQERCGLGERVVISDLTAVFAGNETAPTTIATFFPPVLQRLTIYAPTDAEDAEKQGVLTLASAVARMYRPQSTAITVVNQPRGASPPPAPQFTRAIVVERGDAGLEVINAGTSDAFLKLTGRGDQLAEQASLVINQLQSLAQVPNARVSKAGSDVGPESDEATFGQLKLTGESSVLRTSKFTVGVDRSALGARVDGVQVHLLATHTPVADADSASVMVSVNGQAVYTAPLRDSGRVDAVFDVPGEFLKQRVNFDFDLTFSPRQLCSPTIAPMTFELDPRSTLTMRRGGQPLGGFGAVPSEFSPEFLVALDGSGPSQLDFASRVVANIARQTEAPLRPRVVNVKDAAGASTGALIVANSATLRSTSLRPPIGGESSDVQVALRDELRADINGGLASIQVFADQPRDRTVVLVTSSGAWSLIEPLFGHIDQLPNGWSSLSGDVLAAGAEGTVTELAIGPEGIAPTTDQDGANSPPIWLAIGAGVLAAAVLGLGAALWWRRRRGGAD
ncbi:MULTISPECIES: cellulose biosynthesis cyclic di-GMP-binding regulatory protein BcsB [unclassified Mycolicibacterium]|uniref:cellulose biosynthesis cyclic di-GMP-binding regulatory protein BcsB n=1 Tax=unclassified Mycolicibacterium TaxID=2636767 RepID=UPI001F4C3F74|nr:cellulose biosynthesis cyclic di-GMP-binding regulatory protein BcsB [Mycolicibacterium sp. YH-1]UNB56264.1 cellulose biosynthesis cyclic di-GMP-binding regulatory protein BcsB [Mycolicibacterium sp. YH-1]